ncbi:MAG: tRNA preQ1(34) S-adenosylmethionine ribosyltransferase-isomerase QueA [Spirochaetaceae bacterium]|jgi:S-adenosylmethionine:tRNA ribosyltransferase-isomerase|nr:tRNA preQ1(34) S-adenosylmethionine ribosyltransferase-isomerase QueA [Spirochaetaceae bacterium]
MKTRDFFFDLPEHLIAQFPPVERGQSRLLVLDRAGACREHRWVKDLPSLLEPDSLLVFNKSRVRKARLPGVSAKTGAAVEFLLLTRQDEFVWKVMVKRSKRRRPGSRYRFTDTAGTLIAEAEITGAEGEYRLVRFDRPIDDLWLDRYGHIPLPPYIRRSDTPLDNERYQTVYAAAAGHGPGGGASAAAPTAGLHFTREILGRLESAGMETAFITLHVGPGTFLPVRTERIEDHTMHEEVFSISQDTARRIEKAKAAGRRIVAVGTTSVRTLESAWKEGRLQSGEGATSIFIYPGYKFKVVDALFTNFHTPESTLLMLVSAFADREFILESYREAVREGYRFFSYGDAMLIR